MRIYLFMCIFTYIDFNHMPKTYVQTRVLGSPFCIYASTLISWHIFRYTFLHRRLYIFEHMFRIYIYQSEGFARTTYASPCVRDWPGAGQRRPVCCYYSRCCCCSVALPTPWSCPQSDFPLNWLKPRPSRDPPNL